MPVCRAPAGGGAAPAASGGAACVRSCSDASLTLNWKSFPSTKPMSLAARRAGEASFWASQAQGVAPLAGAGAGAGPGSAAAAAPATCGPGLALWPALALSAHLRCEPVLHHTQCSSGLGAQGRKSTAWGKRAGVLPGACMAWQQAAAGGGCRPANAPAWGAHQRPPHRDAERQQLLLAQCAIDEGTSRLRAWCRCRCQCWCRHWRRRLPSNSDGCGKAQRNRPQRTAPCRHAALEAARSRAAAAAAARRRCWWRRELAAALGTTLGVEFSS